MTANLVFLQTIFHLVVITTKSSEMSAFNEHFFGNTLASSVNKAIALLADSALVEPLKVIFVVPFWDSISSDYNFRVDTDCSPEVTIIFQLDKLLRIAVIGLTFAALLLAKIVVQFVRDIA